MFIGKRIPEITVDDRIRDQTLFQILRGRYLPWRFLLRYASTARSFWGICDEYLRRIALNETNRGLGIVARTALINFHLKTLVRISIRCLPAALVLAARFLQFFGLICKKGAINDVSEAIMASNYKRTLYLVVIWLINWVSGYDSLVFQAWLRLRFCRRLLLCQIGFRIVEQLLELRSKFVDDFVFI